MAVNLLGICNEFRQLLAQEKPDLARIALTIARLEYPDMEPARWLRRIDAIADEIRARLPAGARKEERVAAINQYLFADMCYSDDSENYQDPRNSCLNAVLERRLGIPLTLSLLYIEIAQRLGLDAHCLSFPGHFLVQINYDEARALVLDPINHGKVLAESDLRQLLAEVRGHADDPSIDLRELLVPASRREILLRMLRNLKKIYVEAGNIDKAIASLSLVLITEPNAAVEMRERGLLYREIEAYRAALADLSSYLKLKPDAEDSEVVRHLVVELRAINARFN